MWWQYTDEPGAAVRILETRKKPVLRVEKKASEIMLVSKQINLRWWALWQFFRTATTDDKSPE
jgi:hypothetical protein